MISANGFPIASLQAEARALAAGRKAAIAAKKRAALHECQEGCRLLLVHCLEVASAISRALDDGVIASADAARLLDRLELIADDCVYIDGACRVRLSRT